MAAKEIARQRKTTVGKDAAGARNAEQAAQNAAAGDIVLSAEDLKEMDAIGRTVTDRLDDNPVMWDF